MKTHYKFWLSIFAVAVLSSCSDEKIALLEKDNAQLKHRVDSLLNLVTEQELKTTTATPICWNDAAELVHYFQSTSGKNTLKGKWHAEPTQPSLKSWLLEIGDINYFAKVTGCSGIKLYPILQNGVNDSGKDYEYNSLVMVGTYRDATGENMNVIPGNCKLIEYVLPCPDNCAETDPNDLAKFPYSKCVAGQCN